MLAQRRQPDRHHVEAEEQILAEQSLSDQLLEIMVGRGDDAHIGGDQGAAADGGVFAFLQNAQQPGLRFQRHVADLVEKQAAALGLLEPPDMTGIGAGEGAALMPEQLAFDQLARYRRHVDGDEGAVSALAVIVKRPGDQLLAGTRFAADHHRKVGADEPGKNPVDSLHGRRSPDQRQLFFALPLHRLGVLGRRPGQRPLDDVDQFVEVEGLGQVLEGAALGRFERRQQRVLGAHRDDPEFGPDLADARDEIEAVLIGQDDVGDHQVALAVGDQPPQIRRRTGGADAKAAPRQRLAQDRANGLIVIGDEDGRSCHQELSELW